MTAPPAAGRRVLEAMAEGRTFAEARDRLRGQGHAGRTVGWLTGKALARRGWIERDADGDWRITDAGRRALESR